jgi:uncharacterized membrane protein (UPF0127 family)
MAAVEPCGRLSGLARDDVLGHDVAVASGPRTRLLGLAFLSREGVGAGLRIPRCRSVHTFGMRFDLDIYFLDAAGQPTSVHRAVPPNRLVWDRRAVAVLELPSEKGGESPGPSP